MTTAQNEVAASQVSQPDQSVNGDVGKAPVLTQGGAGAADTNVINPAVATPGGTPAVSDRMDAQSARELMQMVGAMLFVTLLLIAGWHAVHYSGALPW